MEFLSRVAAVGSIVRLGYSGRCRRRGWRARSLPNNGQGPRGGCRQGKAGGRARILVIGPLPEFPWHAPYCVMRSIRLGIDICSIPRANVEARRAKTISTLRGVLDHADGVRFVDPIDLFCTRTECRPNDGAELFFSDMSHLSTAGTARLYGTFAHDFLWALTGEVGKNGSQSKSPH